MTRRERVWRLVPAVFFMSAFNKPSNLRVGSDRYVRKPRVTRASLVQGE